MDDDMFLVVGHDGVRRPAGGWLYAGGPRPPHRVVGVRTKPGVLGRRQHLRAAARRVAGGRWSAPVAGDSALVVPLVRPLQRSLTRTLHPGRRI